MIKNVYIICIFIITVSCAGPTTPFGGNVFIAQKIDIDKSRNSSISNIDISSTPKRQYYNSPYNLTLTIKDPKFSLKTFKYDIVYNNHKLNRWFKTEEIKIKDQNKGHISIHFKNLSILPGNINKISFLYYPAGSKNPITYKLKVPECYKNIQIEKINISPFRVNNKLVKNIESIADKYGYNQALIAALIAQESSFRPNQLSVAKALGLTQITPLAHEEIIKVKNDWKIYPKFKKLPYLNLKTKLISNIINDENDWRLDNKKAIEGGVIYLEYLSKYWGTPEKKKILKDVFKKEIPTTDILLASYNSGAYRVKKSIIKNKEEWLFDKSLNEARKYVMNIKSYCHSFKGVNNEK